jgi:hypothetical protein
MISNCHKNIMGTVSFDGRFPGMNKNQDFVVYPMQDSGEQISIQSNHRFGRLDLSTGKGLISAHRAQYANHTWLAQCMMLGNARPFELPAEDLQTLRRWIKSSGGIGVGESFVKCDNTGALAL